MMTSLDAADSLKNWIKNQLWQETFTPEVPEDLAPPSEPSAYQSLRCIIIPREDEYSRSTRDPIAIGEYEIDVFLAAHIDQKTPREIYNQAHAIVKQLMRNPAALENLFITGVRRVLWLPDHLSQKRIFGTVITVEVRTTLDLDD